MYISFPSFRCLLTSCWPWRTTAQQSQALLRLITVASEENLPLVPLLENWAADERGRQRQRLLRLVRLLQGGTSLADAVEEIPGVLRDEAILAIRFDAHSGMRTEARRALLDDTTRPATMRVSGVRNTLLYFSVVAPLSLLIVAYLQFTIIPRLSRITADFALPERPIVYWSQYLGDVVLDFWWLIALAICALLWLTYSTKSGRLVRRAIVGSRLNLWRESYAADILRKLSLATGAGRPLTGALSTLARYHFDPVTRHKLLFVRNEVEQNADLWRSMHVVGLLTAPEVDLLNTAERVGNRAWALKQLADGKQVRVTRRWQTRATFLLPGLVIAMGGLVLCQAFAVFLPLIDFLSMKP